jgi:hypothetical protein
MKTKTSGAPLPTTYGGLKAEAESLRDQIQPFHRQLGIRDGEGLAWPAQFPVNVIEGQALVEGLRRELVLAEQAVGAGGLRAFTAQAALHGVELRASLPPTGSTSAPAAPSATAANSTRFAAHLIARQTPPPPVEVSGVSRKCQEHRKAKS